MAKRYFNTTLGISMLSDGDFTVTTMSEEQAADFLREPGVENVANPNHGNSLQAITQKLGTDVLDEYRLLLTNCPLTVTLCNRSSARS